MSTPYDESDVHENVLDVARIRELNDALRTCADPILRLVINGQLVITRGVAARGDDFFKRAVAAVRAFDNFTPDNDPHGEHDFAFLHVDGVKIFFKVDYYDAELEWHSPDASDPGVTRRVLTIALAEEY
jgi:hypothetical protein